MCLFFVSFLANLYTSGQQRHQRQQFQSTSELSGSKVLRMKAILLGHSDQSLIDLSGHRVSFLGWPTATPGELKTWRAKLAGDIGRLGPG